jgi:hypothetical protein
MSTLDKLIDKDRLEREQAKLTILSIIDKFALKGPSGYGVTFEGMTCARWQPWEEPGYKKYETALSLDRLYMIDQYMSIAPDGPRCEFGVYNGGVTRFMLDNCRQDVYAYDTFEGIMGSGSDDLMDNGEYKTSDYASLMEYIRGAIIVKGDVRKTIPKNIPKEGIAFAHLDMDVELPTRHVLNHVYNNLLPNGIIVLDDYGLWMTPGIKMAVDDFNPHGVKKIYLPTGQMVITK